jgi:hypothetical protein
MIYNGSEGSICFYYKGLLISSYPLSKLKTYEKYLNQGEDLIYKSKEVHIQIQIKTYLVFCNAIYNRKLKKKPIYREDHIMFLNSLTALMRLRIIDNDESNGYYCFPKKK